MSKSSFYIWLTLCTLCVNGTRYCDVLIAFDTPLWTHLNSSMSAAKDSAEAHVAFANEIFREQLFNEKHDLDDLEFRLKRVMVVYESCMGLPSDGWKNCTQVRNEFLSNFESKGFGADFCLAYLFTYLDFHNGTAGLASVGTVCRRSFNSGFVTMLNFGAERTLAESSLTFVHELGHSLGAHHDADTDEAECTAHNFVMAETFEQSDFAQTFSSCSIRSMKENLRSLINSDTFCFNDNDLEHIELSICGDNVVDPGEQCDCGLNYEDCNDACCYSAHIDPFDRVQNESALQCSTNRKSECINPSFVFYGLKMPPFLVLILIGATYLVLTYDWRRQKMLFKHLENNRIVVDQ